MTKKAFNNGAVAHYTICFSPHKEGTMNKKWMDKKSKRFLRNIKEKHLDPRRKNNAFLDHNLMTVLTFYLETRSIDIESTRIRSLDESKLTDVSVVHDLFVNIILPEISAFARTTDEAGALIGVLYEQTHRRIVAPLYAPMKRKGLMSSNLDMRGMQ